MSANQNTTTHLQSRDKEWDTAFFGKKIVAIESEGASIEEIKTEITKEFGRGAECIYLFSDQHFDLSSFDAVLADRKRSYVLMNPACNADNDDLLFDGAPEDLYQLAYQSGEHSRYRVDPHFTVDEFQTLYRKWIDNSLKEGFADYVLAVKDGEKPIGFITAKFKGTQLSVGLFAVDSSYRGRGIGKRLMQRVMSIASNNGCSVEVTTQADNLTACRVYEKLGFTVAQDTFVYHIWNQP